MDPYFRCQVALAQIIAHRATNSTDPARPTPAEYNLWSEFYIPFWETLFRAYVKRTKAKDPEVTQSISDGYDKAITQKPLSIPDYAKLLFSIGKLYDDLKYSSPEKEMIESPFQCDLKMCWQL